MNFVNNLVDDVKDSYRTAYGATVDMSGDKTSWVDNPLPGDTSADLGAILGTPFVLGSHWLGGNDIHNSVSRRDPRTRHVEIKNSKKHMEDDRIRKFGPLSIETHDTMEADENLARLNRRKGVRKGQINGRSAEDPTSHKSKTPFIQLPPKKKTKKKKGKTILVIPGKRRVKRRTKAEIRRRPLVIGRKRGKVGVLQARVGRRVNPPVAFGRSGSFGAGVSFYEVQRRGCMGMRMWVQLGSIGPYTDGASHTFAVFNHLGSSNLDQSLYLMPQNTFYFPGNITSMAQQFERFRLKMRLQYRPNTSTATNGLFKFVYFDDPCAPYTNTGKTGAYPYASTYTGGAYPNNWSISSAWETSVFAKVTTGWSFWQKGQELNYIGAPTYTGQLNPASFSSEDMQSSSGGVWCIMGNSLPAQSATTYLEMGELWADCKLELCEMMPGPVTATDSMHSSTSSGSTASRTHSYCTECKSTRRATVVKHPPTERMNVAIDRLHKLENAFYSTLGRHEVAAIELLDDKKEGKTEEKERPKRSVSRKKTRKDGLSTDPDVSD